MPKINSRAKGARAERECAKELERLFGCSARRGQQFSGSSDSPDVVTIVAWAISRAIHWMYKRSQLATKE
jgi:Holliday junction resolvase